MLISFKLKLHYNFQIFKINNKYIKQGEKYVFSY